MISPGPKNLHAGLFGGRLHGFRPVIQDYWHLITAARCVRRPVIDASMYLGQASPIMWRCRQNRAGGESRELVLGVQDED